MSEQNGNNPPNPSPETLQPEERTEKKKGKSVFDAIYDSMASVTLAIFLLIILAVTSIFGTVILQKGNPEQYLMEYGPGMYKLFQFLALDDMYRSWWFLTILILLLVNITTCTIKRFPRAWRLMTQSPKVLDDALFKRMKHRDRSAGALTLKMPSMKPGLSLRNTSARPKRRGRPVRSPFASTRDGTVASGLISST